MDRRRSCWSNWSANPKDPNVPSGRLPKGTYLRWLQAEFNWSKRSASRFIRCAEKFGDLDCLDRFHPSALYNLAADTVPEKAVDQCIERARAGEVVSAKLADELATHHRNGKPTVPPVSLAKLRHYVRKLAERLTTPSEHESEMAAPAKTTLAPTVRPRVRGSTTHGDARKRLSRAERFRVAVRL